MRKQIVLVTALMFGLMACGNSDTNTEAVHNHDGHEHEHAVAGETPEGPLDPVCKMVKTDDWTEFTVNNSDTVWFCSPLCKEQYDADPSKFATY
ncbi:MAG TPA: hypothetical protein VLZ83_10550 [Edaphocola sp.]|nr:hypothetical protein [Edaphocola sp.]